MKKYIFFLLVAIVIPSYSLAWTFGEPLVPCGRGPTGICTECDLWHMLDNLMDFGILFIVPVVGTFLFVYAGILYMLGAANPSLMGQARSIFTNTIFGIAIVAVAWIATNTLMINLLNGSDGASITWTKFECKPMERPGTIPAPSSAPPGGPVPGQAQAAAILSSGISMSLSPDDCPPHNAKENIQDIAAGQFPYVCSPTCNCVRGGSSGSITTNPAILQGLLDLKTAGFSFSIESLTTGKHGTNSTHYSGHGADIVVTGGQSRYIGARDFLNSKGGNAFCESASGAKVPDCGGTTDHIHWTY